MSAAAEGGATSATPPARPAFARRGSVGFSTASVPEAIDVPKRVRDAFAKHAGDGLVLDLDAVTALVAEEFPRLPEAATEELRMFVIRGGGGGGLRVAPFYVLYQELLFKNFSSNGGYLTVKDTQRALEHMGQAPYSIKKTLKHVSRAIPTPTRPRCVPDELRRLMEAAVKGEREEAMKKKSRLEGSLAEEAARKAAARTTQQRAAAVGLSDRSPDRVRGEKRLVGWRRRQGRRQGRPTAAAAPTAGAPHGRRRARRSSPCRRSRSSLLLQRSSPAA